MIRDPETLELLLATVRRFVRERLVPNEQRVADDDAIPPEIVAEMRTLGLFGLSIPEEYGGLGLTMEEEVAVAFELARASPAFRSVIGTNNGIGSQGIVIDGTDGAEAQLPAAAGDRRAHRLVRADRARRRIGRRVARAPRARRDGDHYVLNGTKRFITNAPEAGIFTRDGAHRPETRARGRHLGVHRRARHARPVARQAGPQDGPARRAYLRRRSSTTAACPRTNLIGGGEGVGFKTAMKVLDKGRLHIAAVCVRRGRAAARRRARATRSSASSSASRSPSSSSCRRCWPTATPRPMPRGRMVLDAARRRDAGEDVAHRGVLLQAVRLGDGAAASPTAPCRSTAAPATSPTTRSSASTATSACSGIYEGTTQIQQLVIARAMIRDAQ